MYDVLKLVAKCRSTFLMGNLSRHPFRAAGAFDGCVVKGGSRYKEVVDINK